MTADHKFKHWMRTLIVLFIVLFFYIIIADRHAPITTEGRVQGYVVQVAPEVSGKVTDVLIENNQSVHQGDVLFKIDDRKYKIALEQAKLSLQSAYEKKRPFTLNVKLRKQTLRAPKRLITTLIVSTHDYKSYLNKR